MTSQQTLTDEIMKILCFLFFCNFFCTFLKSLLGEYHHVIIFLFLCFVGDRLYTFRDLGYLKPVTDITFHPQDNFIAFGCYGEGGHPVYTYSYDPKGTVIF